jgi:Ca2+-binding RTX toxin-like protein
MKSHKKQSRTPVAPFEQLEGRQMMSATLYGTSLYVYGSPAGDSIQVTKSVGPLFSFVNVVENGVPTGSFLSTSVAAVNVYGFDGNDSIALGNGITGAYVNGGNGADYLLGADGNDSLVGGFGNDYIVGGPGHDYLDGSYDNDTLVGGAGNDSMYGSFGTDSLYGQDGSDYLSGGDDNDYLSCGTGNDTGRGGFGDDEIHGGDGNDYLYGDDGSDWLLGEGGDDCMFGGNGNDYFTAQDGVSEYIDGGAGWDTAFVDDRDWYEPWSANDTRYNVENAFE